MTTQTYPQHLGIPLPVVQLVNMAISREVARVLGVGHLAADMRPQVTWGMGREALEQAVGQVIARPDVIRMMRMLCACPLPDTEAYEAHGADQVEEHFEVMLEAFGAQMIAISWAGAMEHSLLQIYNDREPEIAVHRHGEVAQWLAEMEQDGPICPPEMSFVPSS
jgi:hypothetical protein